MLGSPNPSFSPAKQVGRPGSVTAVAIVNIVLAVLCGCGSLWTVATPAMMEMQQGIMGTVSQQATQQFEAEKSQRIARLQKEREGAPSPQERQRIETEIEKVKAEKMPDMSKFYSAFTTPKVKAFYYFTGAVGIILNLLFLISGIGLFSMRQWARQLAIGASIAFIVSTLISTVVNFLVVLPATTQAMQAMMTEMQKAMPPGQASPPMPNMGAMMQVWSGVWSIVYALLLCAWPVVAICLLSTSRTRAAFDAAAVRK